MTANLQLVMQEPEPEQDEVSFVDVWDLYPKKSAKKDAAKAWLQLTRDEKFDAIVALANWRQIWIKSGEMEYVPHCGSWLRGARWEDELPSQWERQQSHASHVALAAKPAVELGKREIPAHVLEMIKTLRK